MPKWLDEKILISYWEKNYKKYNLPNGTRILKVERNPVLDAYPDISQNELENGETVPCELEWATTNFFTHNHDINVLLNSNGFLVTFIQNAAFAVPQIKIDEDDFVQWFTKDSKRIVTETVETIKKTSKPRTESFIWLIYLGKRGNADAQIGFDNGVWGFPKSERGKRRGADQISDIKADDVVIFIKNFRFNQENKRATPWTKDLKTLVGKIDEIIAVRVTKGFYQSDSNAPWNSDKYPYRFNFDTNYIFKGNNVPCSPKALGEHLHMQIVSQMSKRSIEHINSTFFLKMLSVCARL